DGKIQKFKSTFAQIAKTLSVPVVPVAIQGAYEVMPHTRILPKSGKVTVSFLEMIDPQGLSEDRITRMTRDAIIKVIGQE
ncbi:MAG: lysophospholipid acyltransferase family protein, partial [Spirochaetota bacterium]